LICGAERLNWRELEHRVDALAAVLADLSPPEGRVALVTGSCHRHWETIFAASRAALVSVPLNYRWTPQELARTIEEVDPAVIVLDLAIPAFNGIGLLDLLDKPVVLTFGGHDPRTIDYEESLVAAAIPPCPDRPPASHHAIGFTSGTTGRARGAMLSRRHPLLTSMWLATLFGIGPDDCFLSCMPIYAYRGGSGGLAPMLVGAASVLCDFDAETVLDLIEREHVTHTILAPVMVERILANPRAHTTDISSLVSVWVGGAPSKPESIRAFQDLAGCDVGSTYGSTEATAVVSMRWPALGDRQELMSSIGRPGPLNDVRLVGPSGEEPDTGEPGEIYVRGDTVMKGYWPNDGDGLTNGWYATGDVATRDSEGYLYLVDRRVDVINSGGLNVYSLEVENVLIGHPGVAECAVVSAPDDLLGEEVTAIVVPLYLNLEVVDLETHCRDALASYKRPRRWIIAAELPRNSLGKIDKRHLRDDLWKERGGTIDGVGSEEP
jgi:acyl-CoA synthetase (AMP-forming)/AMP-acid ligase II